MLSSLWMALEKSIDCLFWLVNRVFESTSHAESLPSSSQQPTFPLISPPWSVVYANGLCIWSQCYVIDLHSMYGSGKQNHRECELWCPVPFLHIILSRFLCSTGHSHTHSWVFLMLLLSILFLHLPSRQPMVLELLVSEHSPQVSLCFSSNLPRTTPMPA